MVACLIGKCVATYSMIGMVLLELVVGRMDTEGEAKESERWEEKVFDY